MNQCQMCGGTLNVRKINVRVAFGAALRTVPNKGFSYAVTLRCYQCRQNPAYGKWRYVREAL